jgi:hypothetical protein
LKTFAMAMSLFLISRGPVAFATEGGAGAYSKFRDFSVMRTVSEMTSSCAEQSYSDADYGKSLETLIPNCACVMKPSSSGKKISGAEIMKAAESAFASEMARKQIELNSCRRKNSETLVKSLAKDSRLADYYLNSFNKKIAIMQMLSYQRELLKQKLQPAISSCDYFVRDKSSLGEEAKEALDKSRVLLGKEPCFGKKARSSDSSAGKTVQQIQDGLESIDFQMRELRISFPNAQASFYQGELNKAELLGRLEFESDNPSAEREPIPFNDTAYLEKALIQTAKRNSSTKVIVNGYHDFIDSLEKGSEELNKSKVKSKVVPVAYNLNDEQIKDLYQGPIGTQFRMELQERQAHASTESEKSDIQKMLCRLGDRYGEQRNSVERVRTYGEAGLLIAAAAIIELASGGAGTGASIETGSSAIGMLTRYANVIKSSESFKVFQVLLNGSAAIQSAKQIAIKCGSPIGLAAQCSVDNDLDSQIKTMNWGDCISQGIGVLGGSTGVLLSGAKTSKGIAFLQKASRSNYADVFRNNYMQRLGVRHSEEIWSDIRNIDIADPSAMEKINKGAEEVSKSIQASTQRTLDLIRRSAEDPQFKKILQNAAAEFESTGTSRSIAKLTLKEKYEVLGMLTTSSKLKLLKLERELKSAVTAQERADILTSITRLKMAIDGMAKVQNKTLALANIAESTETIYETKRRIERFEKAIHSVGSVKEVSSKRSSQEMDQSK